MKRRRFLYTSAAIGGTIGVGGCTDDGDEDEETGNGDEDENGDEEAAGFDAMPRVENPPDAVYLPSHQDGMLMLDTETVGDFAISPMLSIPHFFWLVADGLDDEYSIEEVEPPAGDSVHLMVTVWDSETEVVLPVDTGLRIEVERDGELIDDRAPWPMISQGMGYHFGDNYELDGDGTYTATVRVGAMDDVRLTGDLEGRFREAQSATFEFEMDAETRQSLVEAIELFEEDRWGSRDAVPPMAHGDHQDLSGHDEEEHDQDEEEHDEHDDEEHYHDEEEHDGHGGHDMPYSSLPAPEDLPGTLLGTPEFDDAVYATTLLGEGSRFVDGDSQYLVVSPRTPYNRCVLPQMSLSARVGRNGEEIDLGDLRPTLDHELGFHYGATVDELRAGDELVLSIDTIPQVSRHQGYETAFTETGEIGIELEEGKS